MSTGLFRSNSQQPSTAIDSTANQVQSKNNQEMI